MGNQKPRLVYLPQLGQDMLVRSKQDISRIAYAHGYKEIDLKKKF